MKTIYLYEYDELPTAEAKEKARQWWAEAEADYPAWFKEHQASMEAAIKTIENDTPEDAYNKSINMSFTGYGADALLSNLMDKNDKEPPSAGEVERHYQEAWEKEINERLQDIEYIEESIRINEYTFLPDGTRWG